MSITKPVSQGSRFWLKNHAKESISMISLTFETDDHNHIMNDDIIDDDNEKNDRNKNEIINDNKK